MKPLSKGKFWFINEDENNNFHIFQYNNFVKLKIIGDHQISLASTSMIAIDENGIMQILSNSQRYIVDAENSIF